MTHTLLSCPACSAQYNIPTAAIPATGRRVKCTACAYSWQAFAPDVQAEIQQALPVEAVFTAPMAEREDNSFTPQPELEETTTDQQSAALLAQALSRQGLSTDGTAISAKWAKGASVLRMVALTLATSALLLGVGLLVLRQVAPNIPMLAPALAALGVPSPVLGAGLAFENIIVQRNPDGNKLEIAGQLRNKTAKDIKVPSLQIAVFANVGDVVPLKTWVVSAKIPQLAASSVAQLSYQLTDAPAQAAHIKLSFTE